MPVRLVLFDMDDTLCAYDRAGRIAELAALAGRPAAEVQDAIWHSGFEDRGDRGDLSSDQYLAGFAELLGTPLTQAQWLDNRRRHTTPWPDMLALVRRVQRHAKTALFTQNGPLLRDHLTAIVEEIPPLFGHGNLHVSCDLGALKDDPAVYRQLAALHGERPEDTLFVDDVPEFARAAEAAGLHAHRFDGRAGLAARLEALGLDLG